MSNSPVQGCLFEEDFLLRTLGPIVRYPEVALTELVANAWDAGASEVHITIPEECEMPLVIEDDGVGMTRAQFHEKWMTLGYDRVKHQGSWAEFPPDRTGWRRPAYGRNGVGRHGMLCFASVYEVRSRREGNEGTFTVATAVGRDPFVLQSERLRAAGGHGTRLKATVVRNLPSIERASSVLSARFLHDPRFRVFVNGHSVPLSEHVGLVDSEELTFAQSCKAEAFFIDSTKSARTTQYQGIAFWVGGRLVGDPSWLVGNQLVMDGRTRIAKRYTVVVKTDDLFDDITPDWSGFQKTDRVKELFAAVASYVEKVFRRLSTERIQDTTEAVFREHRDEIGQLRPLAKVEVQEFVDAVTHEQPLIQPDALSAAVRAVINLERSRTGGSLLEKLSKLSDEDIVGLDRLLSEWTVRDALTVLDEIDRRLVVVEALIKLSGDKKADELHALHPLVTEARWLFGPEFDSPEFASNVSLSTAMKKVFGKRSGEYTLDNPRHRPDLIVLPDATISGVATEHFDEASGLSTLRDILLIELKRGDSEIGRDQVYQACGYVEDLLASNLLDGQPFFRAFVVGHRISSKIERILKIGEIPARGRVEATTYLQLVRTAEKRLFRLRERLMRLATSFGPFRRFNLAHLGTL
jgi:hypothetical protein